MYEYFWLAYFLDLLIPLLGVAAGYVMWKYSPNHLHTVIGFRTSRAMENGETWRFANEYAGKLLVKNDWIALGISGAVPFIFMYGTDATFEALSLVLCIAQIALIAASLIVTQVALTRKFPKRRGEKRR